MSAFHNKARDFSHGLFTLFTMPGHAHHGVAGVGAAAIEGPGAPIESASSATLPAGRTLAYLKLDAARFKTFDADPEAPEAHSANYWMLGLGYSFTPWLSGYFFVPYHDKRDEAGGLDSRGWADPSWMLQIGARWDAGTGLRLVPERESLDDMEDWHFTLYGGSTLPWGKANHRLADGRLDPGKAHGFGKPAWTLSLTATKQVNRTLTFNAEFSALRFGEYTYDDGTRLRFGAEDRLNFSLAQRLHVEPERRLRLDGVLEAQFLRLGRDIENGEAAAATGGRMLYLVPGVRIYWQNASFALGIKKPVWTRLNESSEQQGAEGKEKWRLIFSASWLF